MPNVSSWCASLNRDLRLADTTNKHRIRPAIRHLHLRPLIGTRRFPSSSQPYEVTREIIHQTEQRRVHFRLKKINKPYYLSFIHLLWRFSASDDIYGGKESTAVCKTTSTVWMSVFLLKMGVRDMFPNSARLIVKTSSWNWKHIYTYRIWSGSIFCHLNKGGKRKWEFDLSHNWLWFRIQQILEQCSDIFSFIRWKTDRLASYKHFWYFTQWFLEMNS